MSGNEILTRPQCRDKSRTQTPIGNEPSSGDMSLRDDSTMAVRRRIFSLCPQERLYLCNWYVKLVRPGKELPKNQVQCHVPMK